MSLNFMNVAVDIGVPTTTYHTLQGKYKQFIAPDHRVDVENWYNNYSTRRQRREFKYVVRCVKVVQNNNNHLSVTDQGFADARALLRYGGEFIARDYLKLVTTWLAGANAVDRQCFRGTFGKMRPISLFAGCSDYKRTYTQENIDNTAERLHKVQTSRVKRRIHEVKLAQLRGVEAPPTQVSSLPPEPEADTTVGSEAMASTCPPSDGKPSRYRPKFIANNAGHNTTYEAFFSAKPPEVLGAASRSYHPAAQQRRPWGDVDTGFVKGTLLSQTAMAYPPADHTKFKNYNENYAAMLGAQYDMEVRRAKQAAETSPADAIHDTARLCAQGALQAAQGAVRLEGRGAADEITPADLRSAGSVSVRDVQASCMERGSGTRSACSVASIDLASSAFGKGSRAGRITRPRTALQRAPRPSSAFL